MLKVEREMLPYIQCFHTPLAFSAFRCALGRLSSHLAEISALLAKPRRALSARHLRYMLFSPGSARRELKPRAGVRSALRMQPAVGCGLPRGWQTQSEDKCTLMWARRMMSACTPWETSGELWAAGGAGRRRQECKASPRVLASPQGTHSFSYGKH